MTDNGNTVMLSQHTRELLDEWCRRRLEYGYYTTNDAAGFAMALVDCLADDCGYPSAHKDPQES